MADQKLKIELDANAKPMLDAFASLDTGVDNITQKLDTANKALGDIEAAGEKNAEGIEKVASSVNTANMSLDGIKDASEKAADGVTALGDKADTANGKLDGIKDASKRTSDGIDDIGQSSRRTAQNVSKASATITAALDQIHKALKKKTWFEKLGVVSIRFNAITDAAKKLAVPLQKAIGQL